MRRLTLSVLSLTFLAACQPGAAPLSDEDVAALNDLRDTYVQAVLAGDADAAAAMYADNAIVMPADAPAIEGRAAIRAYEAEEAAPQDFTLTSVEIDGRGGLAYDRGTWSWTGVVVDTAEAVTLTGKYVSISRKQADGSWLVTVDIWNADAPIPQPE
jgi:ketosteroid isomerase-like protein